MNAIDFIKIRKISLQKVKQKLSRTSIYLLSHSWGGGLSQYVKSITDCYQNINTYIINTNEHHLTFNNNVVYYETDTLMKMLYNDNRKNIIIHININPYIDLLFDYFINMILEKNVKIIITIHDMFWIYPTNPIIESSKLSSYKLSQQQLELANKLFNKAYKLIFPSNFIYGIYKNYFIFDKNNVYVEDHCDLEIDEFELWPNISNEVIKILYLGRVSAIKGIYSVVSYLSNIYEYGIELHVLGDISVNISEITSDFNIIYHGGYTHHNVFEKIKNIQPKIILMSSIVSETWSYTASIILKTGLPIFFNDICVYNERIQKYKRTNVANYCTHTDTPKVISKKLITFIKFLEQNRQNSTFENAIYKIKYSDFYKSLYK